MRLQLHIITVAVAASYLTLGVSNPRVASDLWAVYATVTLLLALANLSLERRPR